MAYKRRLSVICDYQFCRSAARYEVFNNRNSNMGRYCTKHSEKVLDEQLGCERGKELEESDGA